MNRKRKEQPMDVAAKSNISTFPSNFPSLNNLAEEAEKKRRKWWLPITNAIGITMPNEQKPSGWSLNPATGTLALLVGGLLTGGGYYVGHKDAEYRILNERLQKAEQDASEAKKLQTYSAGVADTHDKKEKK